MLPSSSHLAAPPPHPAARRRLAALVLSLLVLAGLSALFGGRASDELGALPEPQRRALYLQTLETLRATCQSASGPTLTEYCRDQGRLLASFPECDAACRELVARQRPPPAR